MVTYHVGRSRDIAGRHDGLSDVLTDLELEHQVDRIGEVSVGEHVVGGVPEALVPAVGHITAHAHTHTHHTQKNHNQSP